MNLESDDFALKMDVLEYLENLKDRNADISSIVFGLRKKLIKVIFVAIFLI